MQWLRISIGLEKSFHFYLGSFQSVGNGGSVCENISQNTAENRFQLVLRNDKRFAPVGAISFAAVLKALLGKLQPGVKLHQLMAVIRSNDWRLTIQDGHIVACGIPAKPVEIPVSHIRFSGKRIQTEIPARTDRGFAGNRFITYTSQSM